MSSNHQKKHVSSSFTATWGTEHNCPQLQRRFKIWATHFGMSNEPSWWRRIRETESLGTVPAAAATPQDQHNYQSPLFTTTSAGRDPSYISGQF